MALHDHYLHGSYTASHEGTSHDADVSEPTPPTNVIQGAPLADPADKWCLQYLRIRHLPAISEAFDDDGSGFIRISEVNEFTGGIPKGWNLLKWVAYWAGSSYHHSVLGRLGWFTDFATTTRLAYRNA